MEKSPYLFFVKKGHNAMLLLGTINSVDQDLPVDGLINFGTVYRRYDKKRDCGNRAFEVNGTSILLQHSGIYHVTAVITFTAPAAGDVTFQLAENGFAIPNAAVTETVTTADTQSITTTLDFYVLVDSNCILNSVNTLKNISIINTGVASTVTNVVVNIDKVV